MPTTYIDKETEELVLEKVAHDLRYRILVDTLSMFAASSNLSLYGSCLKKIIDTYNSPEHERVVVGTSPSTVKAIQDSVIYKLESEMLALLNSHLDSEKEQLDGEDEVE